MLTEVAECVELRTVSLKRFTVHVLPVLLDYIEVPKSTLSNIKLADAGAGSISKLASRLSTHAQRSMQSIIQSRRVAEAIVQQSAQSQTV